MESKLEIDYESVLADSKYNKQKSKAEYVLALSYTYTGQNKINGFLSFVGKISREWITFDLSTE